MTAPLPPTPAPGWYPDPWYPGVVRWFDGAQWTPHAAPAGGLPGSGDLYDGAKGESTGKFAVAAFIARGLVTAFQSVVSAVVLAQTWKDMVDSLDRTEADPQAFGSFTAWSAVSQLLSLVTIAAIVFLCIWTYRATKNARALGLRTAISPGWGVAGWIIPLANLVMPYLSVRDVFPEGSPHRRQAGIWWACEITGVVITFLASITAFATSTGPAVAVGVVGGGFLVAAGILGSRLPGAATKVHAAIAAGAYPG